MRIRPYSSTMLAVGGIVLIGLGLYFILLRPPLLPEDPRYMGSSLAEIEQALPGLMLWLRRVFWVMGGYMLSTGVLTLYVALTAFRARARGVFATVALAGLTSIGGMVIVNFIINSDFKWLLVVLALPWLIALGLYVVRR